jgi:hypothetical protein
MHLFIYDVHRSRKPSRYSRYININPRLCQGHLHGFSPRQSALSMSFGKIAALETALPPPRPGAWRYAFFYWATKQKKCKIN